MKNCGAKMALLKETGGESTAIKKERKILLSSLIKASEYRLTKNAQTRQRKVEMVLLKERKKALDRNVASVKKMLAGMKVETVSLWWSSGNVD